MNIILKLKPGFKGILGGVPLTKPPLKGEPQLRSFHHLPKCLLNKNGVTFLLDNNLFVENHLQTCLHFKYTCIQGNNKQILQRSLKVFASTFQPMHPKNIDLPSLGHVYKTFSFDMGHQGHHC